MASKLITYLLLLSLLLRSQSSVSQVLGLELLSDQESLSIPFDYKHNFLVLEVRMANLPLKFLLDTGAEHVILFRKEITDILGFTYEEPLLIAGADLQRTMYAYITRGIPLGLKNTITVDRDLIVLEEDFLHMDELTGESIDGILGARFFRGLSVEIDYRKKKIILYKNVPQKALKTDYVKLQSTFINHKPYINCSINSNGQQIDTDILMDTGAGIAFLLFLNDESKVSLPTNYMVGNLGRGLGGDIKGYMGKTQELNLDSNFTFNDLITNYQYYEKDTLENLIVSRDGLIGNPILERFNIIIDYVNGELYLKPHRNYNKEIDYDISGLVLYAFGQELSNYFVKEVLPGSPAEKAGIKSGDIVKRMGFLSTKFYTLEQIYQRLIRRKGKKIKLTVERKGQKIRKTILLSDNL